MLGAVAAEPRMAERLCTDDQAVRVESLAVWRSSAIGPACRAGTARAVVEANEDDAVDAADAADAALDTELKTARRTADVESLPKDDEAAERAADGADEVDGVVRENFGTADESAFAEEEEVACCHSIVQQKEVDGSIRLPWHATVVLTVVGHHDVEMVVFVQVHWAASEFAA